MSDIVDELRREAEAAYGPCDLLAEAADEIERLREEAGRCEYCHEPWGAHTDAERRSCLLDLESV